jgi:hypothetical protein
MTHDRRAIVKIVEVSRICDSCGARLEPDSSGQSGYRIAIGRMRPVEADLCRDCRKTLEDAVVPIMKRAGAAPELESLTPTGIVREPCDRCGKLVARGGGGTLHRRRMHPQEGP